MAEASYPSSTDARTNRETISKESIKKGFGDFKKFASTNISRAKQYVTEKTNKTATITEYDSEFASLSKQLDQIKLVTENMLSHVQSIMQPNPNARLEDWARTKFDRPKSHRVSEHTLFSADLAKAADDFGTETQYGSYLSRCSEVEGKLADSRRRFEEKVMSDVITPLKAFMEIDVKGVMRDKKLLTIKRLDLDAHKSTANKAQGDEKVQAAEANLRSAQADFDAQLEKVRKSMRKIVDTNANHMGYLRAFMSAQRSYFAECQLQLGDLEGDSNSYTSLSSVGSGSKPKEVVTTKFEVDGVELDREDSRKARMLYDYDAESEAELTVNSGELLTVTPIPGDDDYIMAEANGKSGKIPKSYIEFL